MTDTTEFSTTEFSTTELVAAFEAVGTGRLVVTATGNEYTFRVGGLTRSLTISDDEAYELAEVIIARRRAHR